MAQTKRKKYRLGPRFFVIAAVICCSLMAAALFSQQKKLQEIEAERAALDAEYQALQNEEQRVGYMIEYAESEEYMLQYAREKLGYVMPEDIKFDIED